MKTQTVKPNMLGSYGPWVAGQMGNRPGELSFRDSRWTDPGEWRCAVRRRFAALSGLDRVRSHQPPEATIVEQGTYDGLHFELLEWMRPYGPPTRAVFLKPAGATEPLPAVLALHDHGGVKHIGWEKISQIEARIDPFIAKFRETYYGGRAWANEIAGRGYAVLVPDAFLFGSRRVQPSDLPGYVVARLMTTSDAAELRPENLREAPLTGYDLPADGRPTEEQISTYNAFAAAHESIVAKSLFSAGLSWPGMFLSDDLTALDYLENRSDVVSGRIGCCGLSGGGLRTNYLAGMDDRIACSVTAGFMTTWCDLVLDTSHTHTWMIYVPELPRLMDYPEVLSMRAPLPSLVLATTEDPLFTPTETERARDILAAVYEKAGAGDNFRMSFHPGPHKFDVPMQEEAFAWFDSRLMSG